MKELTVLSLFDGIACGRVALERAGIPVKRYIASEIEPNAIKVAMSNYPDIEQIGDVVKINTKELPEIDILIGGSPCQGFSASGKGLNFVDPRSRLFFEYVRILKEVRPRYFLCKNEKRMECYNIRLSGRRTNRNKLVNSISTKQDASLLDKYPESYTARRPRNKAGRHSGRRRMETTWRN